MSWLIRLGLRRGWRHGVLNGERTWLIVGAVALLLRLAGRAISREESVVFREVLQPGEHLIITHEPKV
jgi:hypothetical protein